eukprot:scaffold167153_cov32-Tisochrysis_lutea.AAC.1
MSSCNSTVNIVPPPPFILRRSDHCVPAKASVPLVGRCCARNSLLESSTASPTALSETNCVRLPPTAGVRSAMADARVRSTSIQRSGVGNAISTVERASSRLVSGEGENRGGNRGRRH